MTEKNAQEDDMERSATNCKRENKCNEMTLFTDLTT